MTKKTASQVIWEYRQQGHQQVRFVALVALTTGIKALEYVIIC